MNKKILIFDLDGTLAESKSALDIEMKDILQRLLNKVHIAIISGGDYPQFEKQVLSFLPLQETALHKLLILPTCGTKFFRFRENQWQKEYSEDFSEDEKKQIVKALQSALVQSGFKPGKIYGELIEDRGSQITFSALGQQAPHEEKKTWDPDFAKRKIIQTLLEPMIPQFSIRLGGSTSIDVTKQGIDKAYGIKKIIELTGMTEDDMLFFGDALMPGGNDYPVKEYGIDSIHVRDHHETKKILEGMLHIM